MAAFAKQFVEIGANIIGGCCGSTPEHIRAISTAVKGLKPKKRSIPEKLRLASRTKLFEYDEKKVPFVIGERINPTGKKAFAEELREGKTTLARRFAIEQTQNRCCHLSRYRPILFPAIDIVPPGHDIHHWNSTQ